VHSTKSRRRRPWSATSLPDALKAYRASLAIAEQLGKAAPGNSGWQRDLSVAYDKVGDVLRAQGSLGEALKAYRDSLAIAEVVAPCGKRPARRLHDELGRDCAVVVTYATGDHDDAVPAHPAKPSRVGVPGGLPEGEVAATPVPPTSDVRPVDLGLTV